MTAVVSHPTFPQLNRQTWAASGGQSLGQMNSDESRGMFVPRKNLQRTNSSSSVSSTSSTSSTTTVATNGSQSNSTPASSTGEVSQWPAPGARKRPQPKGPWPAGKVDGQADLARMSGGRPQMAGGMGSGAVMYQTAGPQQMIAQQALGRAGGEGISGQPVLYLLSLNGTFERKTIQVPFAPDSLRIGRQTNQKTVPTPLNGFFDSKVLSRQHAEIWADRAGKIWIRDVKSSNGTFVNGTRLSQENRESEPHELQTSDHLELGIDIVSEDQKTVVHHKVAAKVEHAGFLSPSSNLLDMNFGDLDPSMHLRGRNGRPMPAAGMMAGPAAIQAQRPFWLTPITTDQIVKRLQHEMRSARLQNQDLSKTGQFLGTMLSKDDVKDLERPEGAEASKPAASVNSGGMPFRTDAKTRFSDPPAPPPQQPLPEKPDVPSLKRGTTERPKSHPPNTSPIRDNLREILQLQEDLKNTRLELEGRDARLRELEESLQKERTARETAEELARRLEDSAAVRMNGSASPNGSVAVLEEAFEPPQEPSVSPSPPTADEATPTTTADDSAAETSDSLLHTRVESMAAEIADLYQQLEASRQRCAKAEAERDEDRKSLADMVLRIRKDEEARRAASREKSRGRSKRRQGDRNTNESKEEPTASAHEAEPKIPKSSEAPPPESAGHDPGDGPTLSRANTITPFSEFSKRTAQDQAVATGLPYASMLGVVLIGMGLMAYLNGWQAPPKLDR